MAEPARPSRYSARWLVAVQVAVAALLLMAITQLAQVIVTRGLALLGARTDVATIIGVEACHRKVATAPASVLHAGDERMRVEICPKEPPDFSGIKVTAAIPSGQQVTLLVNGSRAQSRRGDAAKITFENVRLHSGDNVLAVAVGDRAVSELAFQSVEQSYAETRFGLLRSVPVGAPITIALPFERLPERIVGSGESADGKKYLLVSGDPETSSTLPETDHAWIGPSGFAVREVDSVPAAIPPLTPSLFRRAAKVTRLASGEVALSAEACLPRDSALVRWARDGSLSANDFFKRVTGLRIDPVGKTTNATEGRLTISATPSCQMLRSQSRMAVSAVSRWNGDLLSTPFDTLQFQGFGDRLQYSRVPAATPSPDVATFVGEWPTDRETLRVETDYATFADFFGNSAEPANDAKPAPRLALAWAKAESGLPVWLRALLSGIAAVAPIIALLVGIRPTSPSGATLSATQSTVIAGLSVLLLLALSAAAQPLLFNLFFRTSDALALWDLLGEARGDGRWIYPDPYGPVALAIALMLVPFFHALERDQGERPSAIVSWLCGIASLISVSVLFALALAQRLPWQGDERVWIAKFLEQNGIVITPGMTVLLLFYGLAVAVLTAWIPLFWAFRTMAPRRGYFRASLIAGTAAILLPITSYAVEAGRLLLLPETNRAGAQPSFLALLGGSILPFTLFFVLLRAFRTVIVATVPEARTARAVTLLRTRNLFLAAILLTLPRLGLDQVAIAASDMGIIDILSIFQSFGLVAAVVLAVVLLRAYSPFAPSGHEVEAPLTPFAFGPAELDILAALFAGYLAMWTSGVLATAVVILVGWPLFMRFILDANLVLPNELATPALAKALVAHRATSALFEARGKEVEARYTKVESDFATLTAERGAIENERHALDTTLGIAADEAKRRLLEFGPNQAPFANGLSGAIAGLGFAILLQLISSIFGVETSGPMTSWAALARRALADPIYSIAPTGSRSADVAMSDLPHVATPDLLLFFGALINACFPWVLLGFIFGFAFHRIRGDDGVIKALVLATGIAIAYAFSQLFVPGTDGNRMMRVIPVFLFLLLVGVGVFDARSLARRKVSPVHLGEVYGFRTSVGYASLIGGVAAFAPILKIVGGALPKG